MDDDVKTETKDRSEIVVKGTWSAAIKRAAVPVSRVFRQLYDMEAIYMQCDPDGNGWYQPKAWEIEKHVRTELARRGISLKGEGQPLGKMNQPLDDDDNRIPERVPEQVASSNGHKPAKPADSWPEFWKELASLPNGAALRKKGIEIRNASPDISITALQARLA